VQFARSRFTFLGKSGYHQLKIRHAPCVSPIMQEFPGRTLDAANARRSQQLFCFEVAVFVAPVLHSLGPIHKALRTTLRNRVRGYGRGRIGPPGSKSFGGLPPASVGPPRCQYPGKSIHRRATQPLFSETRTPRSVGSMARLAGGNSRHKTTPAGTVKPTISCGAVKAARQAAPLSTKTRLRSKVPDVGIRPLEAPVFTASSDESVKFRTSFYEAFHVR
jgi:hypothetical protein